MQTTAVTSTSLASVNAVKPVFSPSTPEIDQPGLPGPRVKTLNRQLASCWQDDSELIQRLKCEGKGLVASLAGAASGVVGPLLRGAGKLTGMLGWGVEATPETPAEQLDNVEQGSAGNCGAISVIKAMQHNWGRKAAEVRKAEDGTVQVKMRDGYEVKLTPEQLEQARVSSRIGGDDARAVEQAITLMAAAAQRYAQEKGVSYQEALAFLNGKRWPDEVAGYFGVQARAVDRSTLDGNGLAIVSTSTHAALVMRTPDGSLIQDDHGMPVDYTGEVVSNGKETGQAQVAFVILDVGADEDEKVKGIGLRRFLGMLAAGLRSVANGRPGEGAPTGSNGQGPEIAQVAESDAVVQASEVVEAAENGTTQDVQVAGQQEARAAESYEQAGRCELHADQAEAGAVELEQEADQLETGERHQSVSRNDRAQGLEVQMRLTLGQIASCQKELGLVRQRMTQVRSSLFELEAERDRLANNDFLGQLEEIERLDNLNYYARNSLVSDQETARKLELELERLLKLSQKADADYDQLSEESRAESRGARLRQESASLRLEARNARQTAAGELSRPELRDLWSTLADPDSLVDAAERRTEQVKVREYQAARGIQANLDFLSGYGGRLERTPVNGNTTAERALGRVQVAVSWLQPDAREPRKGSPK